MLRLLFMWIISVCLLGCSVENTDDLQLINSDGQLIGFGIIRAGQITSAGFIIMMDDGSVLYPVNDYSLEGLQDGDRVVVKYSIIESLGFGAQVYDVRINSLTKILYKNIVDLTSDNANRIGNEPIHVAGVWAVKNMLTFQIEFYGSEKSHSINLVKRHDDDLVAEHQPIQLELRHNANDDQQIYRLTAFVTFDLAAIRIDGQQSVSYVVSWTDYDGQTYSHNGNYSY